MQFLKEKLQLNRTKIITNENGTAILYSNGIMICTKTVHFTEINLETKEGVLYTSDSLNLGKFAQSFLTRPIISITAVNDWAAFIFRTNNVTEANAGTTVLAKGDIVHNGIFNIDIVAIGKWK